MANPVYKWSFLRGLPIDKGIDQLPVVVLLKLAEMMIALDVWGNDISFFTFAYCYLSLMLAMPVQRLVNHSHSAIEVSKDTEAPVIPNGWDPAILILDKITPAKHGVSIDAKE